jgi:DNA replication protein DnaC
VIENGSTFDIINFDACLMNTVEYNLALSDYADYYIASPYSIPGTGQDYTGWLNALGKEPNINGYQLGKLIVDEFYDYYMNMEDDGLDHDSTLAVVDLKKLMSSGFADALSELDSQMAETSVSAARAALDGDPSALARLKENNLLISAQKKQLLSAAGYPEDYLELTYTCPDCKDSGFIDGKKCHCFKQEIINVVYSQSNIREILSRENFSCFTYDYYDPKDINPTTGLSALETAQRAVKECQHFITDFDNKPKNLFFYGDTGVGKTFLSNCVAKELLEQGKSVIYFTAFQLFDILSKGVFDRDADALAAHHNIFDCDLLIIDDLGTEFITSYTAEVLFDLVNTRLNSGKKTIINTNLGPEELEKIYSPRITSRLFGDYMPIEFYGSDIRRIRQAENL